VREGEEEEEVSHRNLLSLDEMEITSSQFIDQRSAVHRNLKTKMKCGL
jgi:hypothetical protein